LLSAAQSDTTICITDTTMTPIRLLLIQANTPDGMPLALDIEQRNIQNAIHRAHGDVEIDIHALPAGHIADIPEHLRRHRPQVVHFACHGDGVGGLQLYASGDLHGETLSAEHLAEILRSYQAEATEPLRAVVLGGCWTEATAQAAAEHIDCAIGFAEAVNDAHLYEVFSPELYGALAGGRSVPNAAAGACAVLRGRGMEDTADMVRVYRRPGVADGDLRPAAWTPPVLSPAHMDYLKMWFGKPWVSVSLAEILEQGGGEEQRVPLLDIYVPLRVDFALEIEVQGGKIAGWWVQVEGTEEAEATEELARGAGLEPDEARGIRGATRQRTWAALGVDETELQQIVDEIQVKLDRRTDGEATKDGRHTWYMEAHDAASVQGHFVLLGEPGSGKSSFLRHLALCLAGELRRRGGDGAVAANASLGALRDWLLDAYTPLYVELRELVKAVFPPLPADSDAPSALPAVEDFWRYVGTVAGGSLAEPGGELRRLCEEGKAILLLDGLDEAPQAERKERGQQVTSLVKALAMRYPKLRMVVAGRPHAYARREWQLEGFGVAQLRSLSLDRLGELARALFPAVLREEGAKQADSFIAAIGEELKQKRIEQSFYANPLFFTLLAGLWLDPKGGRRLPETRAELYRRSVDLLLRSWTRRRRPELSVAETLRLAPDQLRSVLETLACTVHEGSAPHQDTTIFAVKELLGVLYEAGCDVHVRDVPDYLSRHTGLLTSPEHGLLYFTHRSFQEHLAACELVCRTPDAHLPPVALDRRFPHGLLQRFLARPEQWENVVRLAGDELVVQGRMRELGSLLAACVRSYLAPGQAPTAAVLALEIAGEQRLFAADPDDQDVRRSDFKTLHATALGMLLDAEGFTPEQRNVAGELLGARPEHDSRPGAGLRADGLPDIDWVEVPEADAQGRREFIYQEDERRVEPTFWMARFPVTHAQYQAFAAAGYADGRWWEGLDAPEDVRRAPAEQRFPFWNHPRERVSWYEAVAFCRWLSSRAEERRDLLPPALRGVRSWRISLPTEWQWEKAARGHDGRRYPWGGAEYRSGYANIDETYAEDKRKPVGKHYLQKTSAVGMYPQGASPYGICDLCGNVWEWCLDERANPHHIQEAGPELRVLRGGAWSFTFDFAAAAVRPGRNPSYRGDGVGFRVVVCAVPVS
jgi:formylglycine-generating enzyme required for sulfatase activity